LQPTFKRSTHELVCQVPETIELDSYPGALGQVLTNLVQNAHLHGLDGVDHGRIDICAEVRATEVCLSVADNGHGIPEANRRHVFDPFYTTKLGQGGSGLGLPIVRNIVAGALGGHIDFRNLDEGGVVFEVVIPLTAPAAHATEAAAV
jgi:signal transduction histidine kinase